MRLGKRMWIAIGGALAIIGSGGCALRQAAAGKVRAQPAVVQTGAAVNPQMQRFQQKYPGTAALMRSVTGIRILLQSDKHPLTAEQARSLEQALRPLASAPSLPQDRAQQIAREVTGNLTPDQQTDIGLLRQSFRGRRGMSRNRPGAPGAVGRAGSQRMHWMREDMPPDENIFRSGPANRMLTGVLNQLKGLAKP